MPPVGAVSLPALSLQATLAPFLYPFSSREILRATKFTRRFLLHTRTDGSGCRGFHQRSRVASLEARTYSEPLVNDRLNPAPDDFAATPFTDHCNVTIEAGGGGNGCVSFLREKYIPNGPANGGDGGNGGSIYIQAIRGETSLHKMARRREVKAGRGKNGQGSNKNGQKGTDVILQVPVGTVIRELARYDPITVEEDEYRQEGYARRNKPNESLSGEEEEQTGRRRDLDPLAELGPTRREKWLMYPGEDSSKLLRTKFPPLPQPRRSNLATMAPQEPMTLDLDEHMETPILLAAGAMGGFGNPHFVSKDEPNPKVGTKGDGGVKIILHMELKLLADIGLVGLPNAGKSTLLRAISNSRARVGNWAFTTLQPNIGTVVLDDHKGRSRLHDLARRSGRTRFTVADIPGVIEDAHLDKGLGLSFLRHIERARVLAFVIDLSAGDAVAALKALWTEVSEYEKLGDKRLDEEFDTQITEWQPSFASSATEEVYDGQTFDIRAAEEKLSPLTLEAMSQKPWFVVATKADLDGTHSNFLALQEYLDGVKRGIIEHPSKNPDAWRKKVQAVPISGIRGEGIDTIPEIVVQLLQT